MTEKPLAILFDESDREKLHRILEGTEALAHVVIAMRECEEDLEGTAEYLATAVKSELAELWERVEQRFEHAEKGGVR